MTGKNSRMGSILRGAGVGGGGGGGAVVTSNIWHSTDLRAE